MDDEAKSREEDAGARAVGVLEIKPPRRASLLGPMAPLAPVGGGDRRRSTEHIQKVAGNWSDEGAGAEGFFARVRSAFSRRAAYADPGEHAHEETPKEPSRIHALRDQLQRALLLGGWDRRLDTVDALLSVLSVVVYVLVSYSSLNGVAWAVPLELLAGAYFVFNSALHASVTGLSTVEALLEALTLAPMLYYVAPLRHSFAPELNAVLRALHGCHHLRLYRASKHINTHEVRGQLIYICGLVVSMVVAFAAIVHEAEEGQLDFGDCVYFIVVSICTVGYGDIAPSTTKAKMATVALLFTGVVTFPMQSRRLLDLLSQYTVHQRRRYTPDTSGKAHVVLCGELGASTVETFLACRCWVDNGRVTDQVIVLHPGAPTPAMDAVLRDPHYADFVTYLDGSPMLDHDLDRAGISSVAAVFVFASHVGTRDPDLADASTIITALKIKRRRDIPLCLQLMRPENQAHARLLSRRTHDKSVCTSLLKMRLLSKAVYVPGLPTLLCNLVTPSPPLRLRSSAAQWTHEYLDGASQEIIVRQVPNTLKGFVFVELARFVYDAFGAIAFAVIIAPANALPRVVLNPGRFRIPAFHDVTTSLVLIGDPSVVDLSFIAVRPPKPPRQSRAAAKTRAAVAAGPTGLESSDQAKARHQTMLRVDGELPDGSSAAAAAAAEGPPPLDTDRLVTAETVGEFARQFKMSRHPRSVAEAALTPERAQTLQGHIIIAGPLHNLFHFVLPLRSRRLGSRSFAPIVLLSSGPPDSSVWREFMFFTDVYWTPGSPLVAEDLEYAGLASAARVFLFSSRLETGDAADYAPVVFACQTIRAHNPRVDIVVDVLNADAIDFLRPLDATAGVVVTESHPLVTEQFASGSVFLSSILDNLSALAVYTPMVMTVLKHLLVTGNVGQAKRWDDKMAGVIDPVVESTLLTMPVPPDFKGNSYGQLVVHLTRKALVPIGLMRGVFAKLQQGASGNTSPFVYTNPPTDATVFKCDSVFVLSQKEEPQGADALGSAAAAAAGGSLSPLPSRRHVPVVDLAAVMERIEQLAQSVERLHRRMDAPSPAPSASASASASPTPSPSPAPSGPGPSPERRAPARLEPLRPTPPA